MFDITNIYSSPLGKINSSRGTIGSQFSNKTKGIAFKYVSKGEEVYHFSGKNVPLQQGQFILLPCDLTYKARVYNDEVAQGICIDLVSSRINHDHIVGLYGHPFTISHIIGLQQSLFNISKVSNESSHQNSIIHLSETLNSFTEVTLNCCESLSHFTKKRGTQILLFEKLFVAKKIIDQEYCKKLQLKDLAKRTGLSHYYLLRLFHACFDCSPLQYQIKLRMVEAARLLKSQRHPVSDVAYRLGYADLAAFSNQFKKHHHCPPSDFGK